MSTQTSAFEGFIGQDKLKRKLSFFARSFALSSRCPFLLCQGEKGTGKTEIMRRFAKELNRLSVTDEKLSFLEINSSTITSLRKFIDTIFTPILDGNKVFVFFDEAHELPKDLVAAFLTILDTRKSAVRNFQMGDESFQFNFNKLVFCFATTEPDRLFPPFVGRLEVVDFAPYSLSEMEQIVKVHCEDLDIEEIALTGIVQSARGNARSAVLAANKVEMSAKMQDQKTFSLSDWILLRKELGVLPLGIHESELKALKVLRDGGPQTLTVLASKIGLSPTATRRSVETYLHSQNLIIIDTKRVITKRGVELLKKIEEAEKTA